MPRCPTGIKGLDEVTNGGLPLGRPTLVCGGAGCGKTLLGIEFLVRGASGFAGRSDLGHLPVAQQNVHERIDPGRRVDEAAAFDQQAVIFFL